MKIIGEMNLNFTRLLTLVHKKFSITFLVAILDFQNGCHSSITLKYTRIFLIMKNIGSDTKFVIVCNKEWSICDIFNLEPAILKMVT